jgi:hypothetical protein
MIDALQILLWLAVPLNYIYWIFIHHDEDYKQALKMKKMDDKIDALEFELYVKKAERNQLNLEIFTNRKVDLYA